MHILIIGAGAIGCFFAARLAASGQRVTVAERPPFAAAIRARGIRLQEPDGRELAPAVAVVDGLAAALAAGQGYDLAFVAVKAYHTESVAQELAAHMTAAFPALTVQNGVGNEETLARHLPGVPILSAALTTPIELLGPGQVKVARSSFRLGLAPGPQGGDVQPLAPIFRAAGFETQVFAGHRGLKWTKLLMNLLANAQSAILGYTPAQIFADPALGGLEMRAWREALAVMQAHGIRPVNFGGYPLPLIAPLARRMPPALLRPLMGQVIGGGRGSKMPSLYFDLHPQPRALSEIGWLNGAVVAYGAAAGVPTPVNAVFTQVMQTLIAGDEPVSAWQGQPQRLLQAVAQAGG